MSRAIRSAPSRGRPRSWRKRASVSTLAGPGSRFASYLVTDRSGERQTFFKAPNPGLSSTDRDAASGRTFGDDLEPEEASIETITLDDLLEREGVDPEQAYEVFTHSTSDSSVMRRRFPLAGVRPEHPASKDFEPMFRLDLLVKDITLAQELLCSHGLESSMGVTAAAPVE